MTETRNGDSLADARFITSISRPDLTRVTQVFGHFGKSVPLTDSNEKPNPDAIPF